MRCQKLMLTFKRQSTRWSNTTKICRQFETNCLSVFDHFVSLVLKGLRQIEWGLENGPNRRNGHLPTTTSEHKNLF